MWVRDGGKALRNYDIDGKVEECAALAELLAKGIRNSSGDPEKLDDAADLVAGLAQMIATVAALSRADRTNCGVAEEDEAAGC
jgi:hypothetical protein